MRKNRGHPVAMDLQPLLLDLSAVALSFRVASAFWLAHGVALRKAIGTTVPFLISNLVVLLCITLLPISTRVLRAGPLRTSSGALYSTNPLATSLAEFVFRRRYPKARPCRRAASREH